jgi:molecular chaperone DnaK (HSP70)
MHIEAVRLHISSAIVAELGDEALLNTILMARIKDAAEAAVDDLSTNLSTRISLPYFCVREGVALHLDDVLTRAAMETLTTRYQTNRPHEGR